jgi:hypothetical protein
METMSYPCSPLIPFPTQHEESSYLLWSPQVVIPHENGNMSDVDPIPSPDVHQDIEFMDMLIQEVSDMFEGDSFASFDGSLVGQENDSLVAPVREELMEQSSLGDLLAAGARAVDGGQVLYQRLGHGISYKSYQHAVVSSFDHLACYFARGLHSRMSRGVRTKCQSTAAPARENRGCCKKSCHRSSSSITLQPTKPSWKPLWIAWTSMSSTSTSARASLISDLVRNGSKTFHLTADTA